MARHMSLKLYSSSCQNEFLFYFLGEKQFISHKKSIKIRRNESMGEIYIVVWDNSQPHTTRKDKARLDSEV